MTTWEIGADSRVIYQPQPPRLKLVVGVNSMVLTPPSDRAEHEQFTKFLKDLREAATDFAVDCHPALRGEA